MSSALAAPTSELRQRSVPTSQLSRSSSSSSLSSAPSARSVPDPKAPLGTHDNPRDFIPPPFTIKDLLSAIPQHCFERSAIKSSIHLAGDFVLVAAFAYAASWIDTAFGSNGTVLNGWKGVAAQWAAWAQYVFWQGTVLNGWKGVAAQWAAWAQYVFWQGTVLTGVWVIAHECGHQAYSASKTINNAVGWVLHSALLVPYHSWRITHAKHHAATGHMTRDQVFVPKTRSHRNIGPAQPDEGTKPTSLLSKADEVFEDSPLWTLIMILAQQLVGWPMYLFTNASGQKYPAWTNHFNPECILFDARHRRQILVSDLGIAIVVAALGYWINVAGFAAVAKYYFLPYLVVNHHLVLITYLQHTDPQLPHYRDGQWNFQRGALCTVDRKAFGFIGPYLLHGICETHVLHHLSSKIPHYNAWEATEALKEVLGDHYHSSDENMYVSLWKSFDQCRWVEDEGDVVFYKDKYGRVARRVVFDEPAPSDSGVDVMDK